MLLSGLDKLLSTQTGVENAQVAFGHVPGTAGTGAMAATVALTVMLESCSEDAAQHNEGEGLTQRYYW